MEPARPTTMRPRREEWIAAGCFARLEQIVVEGYDRIVGLDLSHITVDGQITKAPCGGEVAGKSPVDRGKLGIKYSRLTDAAGVPLGCVIAGAKGHDPPLLRPTLEHLAPLADILPESVTVHLDCGYDSTVTRDLLEELGLGGRIQSTGTFVPIDHTRRWVAERTNSWCSGGFNLLLICTERRAAVIAAFLALATAVILTRRLVRRAWTTHRWNTRPRRRP